MFGAGLLERLVDCDCCEGVSVDRGAKCWRGKAGQREERTLNETLDLEESCIFESGTRLLTSVTLLTSRKIPEPEGKEGLVGSVSLVKERAADGGDRALSTIPGFISKLSGPAREAAERYARDLMCHCRLLRVLVDKSRLVVRTHHALVKYAGDYNARDLDQNRAQAANEGFVAARQVGVVRKRELAKNEG